MHSLNSWRPVALMIVLPVIVLAQSPTNTAAVDASWSNVLTLSKPAATKGANKTPAQLDAERAPAFRGAAEAARSFYAAYPNDKRAAQAKKLEATCGLMGVINGDALHEQSAQAIAKSYRENKTNPIPARFQVALLSEKVTARMKLGGSASGYDAAELEKIADKLRAEFGRAAMVYDFYISIAREADMTTARRIASHVKQWPSGPWARREADAILGRDALLGQTLKWNLKQSDGSPLELSKLTGQVSVIYACHAQTGSRAVYPLAELQKSIPTGARFVYLALGTCTNVQFEALKRALPLPGTVCRELHGPTGSTAQPFQIRHAPYVFVLNRSGALVGYGPVRELANLLAKAAL